MSPGPIVALPAADGAQFTGRDREHPRPIAPTFARIAPPPSRARLHYTAKRRPSNMAATLHGLVAQRAPTVVVLRRGPTRHTRLVRWDLRDDSLDLRSVARRRAGARRRAVCRRAASSSSTHGAQGDAQVHRSESRPPSFTALAFWEERLALERAAVFSFAMTSSSLGVTHPPDQGSLPRGLTVSDMWSHFAWSGNRRSADTFGEAVLKAPEAHQGWSRNNRRAEKEAPRTHGSRC